MTTLRKARHQDRRTIGEGCDACYGRTPPVVTTDDVALYVVPFVGTVALCPSCADEIARTPTTYASAADLWPDA